MISRSRSHSLRWLVLSLFVFISCASLPSRAVEVSQGHSAKPSSAPLLLVSIDGFRTDYIERFDVPNLRALAGEGIRADGMTPVFPSSTFPNHHSIATGLYPAHHGIISNKFRDPRYPGETFVISDPAVTTLSKWWGGEPIWITAEKQGVKAATMFWPGSDVVFGGRQPSYFRAYDKAVPSLDRVRQIFDWLDLPAKQRPQMMTLYFEAVDTAGHGYGPFAPETEAAAKSVDDAIGVLVAGLKSRGLYDKMNLIVLADHGMLAVDPERIAYIGEMADVSNYDVVGEGALMGLYPKVGKQVDIEATYRTMLTTKFPVKVYRADKTPARYHYSGNARIAPILVSAEPGAYLMVARDPNRKPSVGTHGYDNRDPGLRALFMAHGPAFREHARYPQFDNIHVYELMNSVLGTKPAPNDGSLAPVKGLLRQ